MFEEQEFKKILLLMKTCMVISIIAAFVVICTHYRGFSLTISPVAADTKIVVVERPAPTPAAQDRKSRPTAEPSADETEDDYQAPVPIIGTPAVNRQEDIQPGPSALLAPGPGIGDGPFSENATAPVVGYDGPQWQYRVTVREKRHRWPRRMIGGIGRGIGKVFGFRR
jgi:hypothetical protein